jgi:hypothetical protein
LWQFKAVKRHREVYRKDITEGLMIVGIIASVIGIGILAYNHYYCSVSEQVLLLACGLVVTGMLFYFFLERE